MMKFILAVIAVFSLACGTYIPVRTVRDLNDDLNDFLKLIPLDKIEAIVADHAANDPEAQELVSFLETDEMKTLVEKVNETPEAQNLYKLLLADGLDIYSIINQLNDLLGWPHVEPESNRNVRKHPSHRTVREMLDEIEALLPLDDLKSLFDEKLQSSPDFKQLYDTISSQEYRDAVDKLIAEPTMQELESKLEGYGVNLDTLVKLVQDLLGWH